jgi:hypothetical protein
MVRDLTKDLQNLCIHVWTLDLPKVIPHTMPKPTNCKKHYMGLSIKKSRHESVF